MVYNSDVAHSGTLYLNMLLNIGLYLFVVCEDYLLC